MPTPVPQTPMPPRMGRHTDGQQAGRQGSGGAQSKLAEELRVKANSILSIQLFKTEKDTLWEIGYGQFCSGRYTTPDLEIKWN